MVLVIIRILYSLDLNYFVFSGYWNKTYKWIENDDLCSLVHTKCAVERESERAIDYLDRIEYLRH